MTEPEEFYYEPDTTKPMSTEVVPAIAEVHDEDVLDQKWYISDDINTDALEIIANLTPEMQLLADDVIVVVGEDDAHQELDTLLS